MVLNGAAAVDDGLWGLNAPFGFVDRRKVRSLSGHNFLDSRFDPDAANQ
jgi:hypothetical protein